MVDLMPSLPVGPFLSSDHVYNNIPGTFDQKQTRRPDSENAGAQVAYTAAAADPACSLAAVHQSLWQSVGYLFH